MPGMISGSSVIRMYILESLNLSLKDSIVLECVSTPPGNICKYDLLVQMTQSQQDPHQNSVQEPGPNARRYLS